MREAFWIIAVMLFVAAVNGNGIEECRKTMSQTTCQHSINR
jgi:hypothetical protein